MITFVTDITMPAFWCDSLKEIRSRMLLDRNCRERVLFHLADIGGTIQRQRVENVDYASLVAFVDGNQHLLNDLRGQVHHVDTFAHRDHHLDDQRIGYHHRVAVIHQLVELLHHSLFLHDLGLELKELHEAERGSLPHIAVLVLDGKLKRRDQELGELLDFDAAHRSDRQSPQQRIVLVSGIL